MYARTLYETKANNVPRIQRSHHPSYVKWNGDTVIHFYTTGVKTTTKTCKETVPEPAVKPLNNTSFKKQHWIFQQDSVPAHKSKHYQEWLANEIPTFM